jgi:hypothetical protein
VVTGDPAARPGRVMVLDGAHPVDAAHPGFSVPLDGLLAGQVIRVHTVQWTGHGPRFSALSQPLSVSPAVTFPAANAPYLVGVITAAAPLVPPAPAASTTPILGAHETPAPPDTPRAGHGTNPKPNFRHFCITSTTPRCMVGASMQLERHERGIHVV